MFVSVGFLCSSAHRAPRSPTGSPSHISGFSISVKWNISVEQIIRKDTHRHHYVGYECRGPSSKKKAAKKTTRISGMKQSIKLVSHGGWLDTEHIKARTPTTKWTYCYCYYFALTRNLFRYRSTNFVSSKQPFCHWPEQREIVLLCTMCVMTFVFYSAGHFYFLI